MKYQDLPLLACLLLIAETQTNNPNLTTQPTDSNANILVFVICLALAAFLFYDWRRGFIYLEIIRNILTRLWQASKNCLRKIKQKTKKEGEKVSGQEQQHSSKPTLGVLQGEKTFVQSELQSGRQSTRSSSEQTMQFKEMIIKEEENPKIDLKEVFESDKKGKQNKKSKSKLRDRVKIKKSELEAEQNEEELGTEVTQQLKQSVDVSEV